MSCRKNEMKRNSYSIPCKGIRLIFLLFLFLMSFSSVICGYIWSDCNNASTYNDGSKYSTNLNEVINDLYRNASKSSGFYTSSHGQSPNKVYGLLQCIENISAEKCSYCSQQANNSVLERCGNDIGGKVWMDDCFLRYGNSNFISKLDTTGIYLVNVNNLKEVNLIPSKDVIFRLLSNLVDSASANASKRFADGSSIYSSTIGGDTASVNIYGRVQCWRDISIKDCGTCLSLGKRNLEQCCYSKQGAQAQLGSCRVRYEIYPFFDNDSPSPSPAAFDNDSPSPAAFDNDSPSPSPAAIKKSSRRIPMILGITGGVILTLVSCSLAMRSKIKSAISSKSVILETQNEETRLFKNEQVAFSLETLIEATGDFNDKNKLGEGGFGLVYKGMTRDGKEIAVKKLSAKSAQGIREFMNEVELVANIQHRNLVNLLGCCAQGAERLLVYEYLPNKSLDTILFDPEKRRSLKWQKRYDIILGISRGLLYLHEDSQLRIIHRDIKTNNILLDQRLNPKIADFGLARLFPDNETQIQSKVAGTYGYMAPEYAMGGQLSVKADIYSFGVLILEIVSGRKNTDINFFGKKQMLSLLEWAWRVYKGGHVLNIVDSVLVGEYPEEQVIRCIHIGLLCTQADPEFRPLISNVVTMISSDSVPLPNPTRPAFVSMTSRSPNISIKPILSSRNETSTSELEPR